MKYNNSEQWLLWQPIEGLEGLYDLGVISDRLEGLEVTVYKEDDNNKKVQVLFDHSVDSYRVTYESFRYKDTCYVQTQLGADLFAKHSFFKVQNSTYLQWLSEQSCGITDDLAIMHFVIFTMEFVVDIAATYEPKISFI